MRTQAHCILVAAVAIFALSAKSSAEELKVLSTFPKGEAEARNQTQTIVATFTKPMVPLQALPEGDGSGPLTISPAMKGKYRWIGVNTISFTPSEPLEIATTYKITIPAGIKSVDGSVLAKAVTWSFTTQRPVLLASYPVHNQQWIDLRSPIYLRFSLPMDFRRASSFIRVKEQGPGGQSVPFQLDVPSFAELTQARIYWPDSTMVFALRPQRPLTRGVRYIVSLAKEMPASRGTLGLAKEASFAFETYSTFSFIRAHALVNRRPHESLIIRFTNPVQLKELAQHMHFSPEYSLSEYDGYDWASHEMNLYVKLNAETKYTVRIDKNLKDKFGQRLGKDVEFTLSTTSFDPSSDMTTGHGIVEAYSDRMYPVNVVNVNSLDVAILKLARETIVPIIGSDTIFYRNKPFQGVFFDVSKQWQPKAKRNIQTTVGLKLDEALNAGGKGAVLIQVSDRAISQYLRADVQVTEMGLTTKYSPEDVLVWVTTLKNAAPIANANVELRDDANNVLWQGKTNGDGFAKAPGWGKFGLTARNYWQRPRVWVIVTKDDDLAYTSSDWQAGIEPYRFNIGYEWNPEFEPWQGTLFTDRGIYRPGEEVSFKGIIRNRRNHDWAIRNGEFYVRIYNSRNEQVLLDSLTLNEFGALALTYKIPSDAHLGSYRIEAFLKRKQRNEEEDDKIVASEIFRVEAYRVSEFEVNARFPAKSYIVGDSVAGSFSAKYLFGGAMKDDRMRWRLRFDPSNFTPEGWENYWFGRNAWWYDDASGPQSKLIYAKDTTLDANGEMRIHSKTQVGDIRATGMLVLEGDVTSPSRQTISGRASVRLHGGEFYIGIQPSSTFVTKDSLLTFTIVTVSPEGKQLFNKNIEYRILKREWNSVRKASAQGGFEWQSVVTDTTLLAGTLQTSADTVAQTYTPSSSGYYIITATGKDSRGNEVTSDSYFYASGSDYVAWERTNDDRTELIADKPEYKPGQTARIIVKNPYEEAPALISVEREGVMRHWRTTLKGSAPEITIPLTEESLPNVFVSVVLLQGRLTKTPELDQTKDVGKPSFKIGYIQLRVDPRTRHLSLTTKSDKQQYRPGDTVNVSVNVRDAAGTPIRSEVTISVADKGVLNLIGYTLPDPFDVFYGPRSLAVSTTESRAQIVQARSFGEKGEEQGGGGGMDLGGIETRGNFKYTAYWNPTLRTDSTGKLTVRFTLPDNLTTFKIMAVAQSKKSEFGYAEYSFTVAKPLLLQASMPRFARLGDSFEAGVVVYNYSDAGGTVALKTSSEGISFKGNETTQVDLKPGESKEIRQRFIATRVGKATFTFQAAMGKETDGLTVSIPIQIPRQKETVAQFEEVAAQYQSKLKIPANTYEDLGSLEFATSSTALTGIEKSVEYLFDYPYGCIEQKASKVLPLIQGKQMVESFGLQLLKGKDLAKIVDMTIREFGRYQTYSGGFAYWQGSDHDSPYASAYAMYVLMQAKKNGYTVPSKMMERGTEYIQSVLRYQENMPSYPYSYNSWSGTKMLILYTLAMMKIPEPAYYETYFKNLDRIPLFAKASLLKAIYGSTKNTTMVKAIQQNLLNSIKLSPASAHFEEPDIRGLEWCWNSNTRTTAIILQALLETDGFAGGKADVPARIVKWLLQQQRSGRWGNTQENVFVVDALSTYYNRFERDEPKFVAEIKLAGQTVLSKMYAGRSLKIDRVSKKLDAFAKDQDLDLMMKKDGQGTMYATVRMIYYPKGETIVRDEGIAVFKTIEPIRTAQQRKQKTGQNVFSPGTIVRVTLRVITPQQRNFVVVDDPIPAGLEPVNTSLQTESSELDRILSSDVDTQNQFRWWGSFNHSELKDDRVLLFADELEAGVHSFTYLARATTFGTFSMPATQTEMMYEPEVFGHTAGGTVEVK